MSTSLNSISTALNSVSSISKSLASISDSSASEDDKKSSMYIRDVEQVTYLFLRGKISEWEENLQAISETYGYLTWKESPYSFVGIGRAIRKANISKQEYISFLQSLSKGNPRIRSLVAAGYQNKD
ncbi:MAG: putative lipoprotein [Leptospiraceae bacterium]|nr:putative lipoprotein [Leptospiraceae bacterium]